jgi:hypothetical protein
MVEAHMAEIRDRGRPCRVCGEPARNVGLWTPTERLARYLGSQPGKVGVVVYALCRRCIAEPGITGRVEAAIVADHRARLAAAEAGLEIADGFMPFHALDDVRRFAEAFERHKPPL